MMISLRVWLDRALGVRGWGSVGLKLSDDGIRGIGATGLALVLDDMLHTVPY